jgi:hypothetical protein
MFKSKSAIFGVAVAVAASVLLVSGMAVTSTSGAGTDYPSVGGPGPSSLTPPDNTANPSTPGNPPASPVEPPAIGGTQPTTNPVGGQAGAGTLPDAGFGPSGSAGNYGSLMIVLGIAGLIFAGAGATVASSNRRK